MPSHGHPFRTAGPASDSDTDGGFMTDDDAAQATRSAYAGTPSGNAGQQIGGTGGGGAHPNMQPWLALNWIVKY
jgi:microcystin-dependent protein